jgi:hypothetical protein
VIAAQLGHADFVLLAGGREHQIDVLEYSTMPAMISRYKYIEDPAHFALIRVPDGKPPCERWRSLMRRAPQ